MMSLSKSSVRINSILYFNDLTVTNGVYPNTFTLACLCAGLGTYKVVVGQGTDVATDEFTVVQMPQRRWRW